MLIKENFLLKSLCTFGIGGPARYLLLPKNKEEIAEAFQFAASKQLKPFVYGGGSNILFPDEGLNTVVIKISSKEIEWNPELELLTCQSGVTWNEIARYCIANKIYGLEALYGLPGTIGGAVYGNAGCHGLETKDRLVSVELYNSKTNSFQTASPLDLNFEYRHTSLKDSPNLIVIAATFKLSKDATQASGDPAEHAKERKVKQPTGLTTGSFFKNPENDYAGRLIEEAGLKGLSINGIQVSDKHANFFINTKDATAKDVIALKDKIQAEVFAKFKIMLEPEVQIVESQDW